MTDSIVIGGGLIGLLCARELSRAGLEVIVLERGKMGRWWYPLTPLSLALCQCRNRAGAMEPGTFPTLIEELYLETGIDPQYQQSGLLILDSEEQTQAQVWAKHTDTVLHILDQPQLAQCEPRLSQAEQGPSGYPGLHR